MRSQHAIQKAKRKRQRRRHQDQPTDYTKKPFSASVLLVHGIGNQDFGELLHWTPSIVNEIKNLSNSQGWHFNEVDSDFSKIILLEKGKDCRKIYFQECIWSDAFSRPAFKEMFLWTLSRLPLIPLFLLTPDSKDWDRIIREKFPIGPFFRFVIRLLLLMGAAILALTSILHALFFLRSHGAILSTPVALVTGVLVWVFREKFKSIHKKYNWIGHVRVAASQSKGRNSGIAARLDKAISRACSNSNNVTVLAHSQGGFLAHERLSKSRHNHNVSRLIGVGSGLRPINVLAACESRGRVFVIWLLLLNSLITALPLFYILTWFSQFLKPNLKQLVDLVPYALTSLVPLDSNGKAIFPQLAFSFPDTWDVVRFVLASVFAASLSVLSAFIVVRLFTLKIDALRELEWIEITTPHDIVGRIPFPKLADHVINLRVGAEGNPLRDHLNYFKPNMLTPKIVATCLIKDAGLRTEQSLMDYEELGSRLNLILAKRWKLTTIIVLIVNLHLVIKFFLNPFSMFALILPVALFVSNSIIRIVQYLTNRILREHDIKMASSNEEISDKAAFLHSSAGIYVALSLVCLDLLQLYFSYGWIIAISQDLVQTSGTPLLLSFVTLLHSGWVVLLCSGYDVIDRWAYVTLSVASTIPLFSLILHPIYQLTFPEFSSIPLDFPFGLVPCAISLLSLAPTLICCHLAEQSERISDRRGILEGPYYPVSN